MLDFLNKTPCLVCESSDHCISFHHQDLVKKVYRDMQHVSHTHNLDIRDLAGGPIEYMRHVANTYGQEIQPETRALLLTNLKGLLREIRCMLWRYHQEQTELNSLKASLLT